MMLQRKQTKLRRQINWARLRHRSAPVLPLVLINLMAGFGQYLWAQDHLTEGLSREAALTITVMYAAVVESIAVYLMWAAHTALLAGDAAGWLRLGAYAAAAWAGFVNYSHWGESSVIAGLVFAVLSGISPWLWSIYSRLQHRDQLRSAGLIEPRAVKFSRSRWLLHFGRTWSVYRSAVWAGVASPAEAIERFDPGPRANRRHRSIERAGWRLRAVPSQNQSAHPAPTRDAGPAERPRLPVGPVVAATVASPPRATVAVPKSATSAPKAPTPPGHVAPPDLSVASMKPAQQVAWLALEMRRHPDRTGAEWAAVLGCSERTADRRLADAKKVMPATDGATPNPVLEESTS